MQGIRSGEPVRRLFLTGLVASAAVVVVGIETLSPSNALSRASLAAIGLLAGGAFIAVLRQRSLEPRDIIPLTRLERAVVVGLSVVGACTLIVALCAPPNTWDSMTYHMARVAEWYDHGTVAFYPTAIDRQLWQPPFAEYLLLVAYGALGRQDYLANLPQWMAAAGAAIAAMEIARLLGASRPAQFVAALVVATTPTVVLEASSTQNDLLAALWLSIAAYLALSEYIEPRGQIVDAVLFGAAFGLAIGTKGTALPIGLPWLAVFLVASLQAWGLGTGARQGVLVAVTVLALNAGQYTRNLESFDSPLGPTDVQRVLRPASLEPAVVVSNLVANGSIHLGTPWVGVNAAMDRAFAAAHARAGLDLQQLYPYFGGFRVVPWSADEGLAGNPLHFLLGLLGFALAVGAWGRLRREHRVMILALVASALLLAMTVRWQPFNGRLHLPLFVLGAPGVALVLARVRGRWLAAALVGLAAGALPSLLSNNCRPLIPWATVARGSVLRVPRDEQYFANRPSLYRPYSALIQQINETGCTRVGLFAEYDSWEYPLWSLGRPAGLTFVHEAAAGGTPARPQGGGPCLWIGLEPPPEWRAPSHLHLRWRDGPLSLWQ